MSEHRRPPLLAFGALPLVTAAMVLVVGAISASAATQTGSAFGYHAFNITIFGGAQKDTGPTPVATLNGGAQTAPTGVVAYGPATLFTSDAITVQSSGTATSVKSTSDVKDINKASTQPTTGSEPLTADDISSTCTAASSGNTGSTTVTNGHVATAANSNGTPTATTNVPTNPAPNTTITGAVSTGDTFRDVFNEQTTSGGVLTVNAVHEYFLGPTLKGDLIIGQVVCGLSAAAPGAPTPSGTSGSRGTPGSSGSNVPTPATGGGAPWWIAAPLAVLGAGLLTGAGFVRRRSRMGDPTKRG